MTGSPETPAYDAAAFDDSFFAAYDQQLLSVSVKEQASLALADLLSIVRHDGTQKTYQEIQADTQKFFDNDWVRRNEAVMNRMATEFTQACLGHSHGAELAQDVQLGSVFSRGVHGHDSPSHLENDDETDLKSDKKKKKRSARIGWFALKK